MAVKYLWTEEGDGRARLLKAQGRRWWRQTQGKSGTWAHHAARPQAPDHRSQLDADQPE